MKETSKQVILLFSSIAVAFTVGATVFGGTKEVEKVVPKIVTQYDTVEKSPKWLADSIKKWKKVVYTTDTINLTPIQIVINDERIPIDSPATKRPSYWPLLGYTSGGNFGDTAFVRTFSLKDGRTSVSKIFVPGILTGIDAEVNNPTPRLNFKPFPPEERHNWFYPIKHALIGAGVGAVAGFGACIVAK